MIPPPPLPPGLNLGAISASPQAFQHPGPANSFPTMHTQPARQHLPVAHELLDSDKEEGEVSEGDHISQSPTAGARIQLEPPRSVPQADAGAGNNSTVVQQDTYNPAHPASGQSPRSQSQNQQQSFSSSTDNVTGQRDEAKKFIRLLHANNIGYHSLSAEGLDANALRKLYRSLNLPSEPEPVPPPTDSNVESSVATSNSSLANSRQMATTVKTNIPPTPPVHSAPSPVDRKDYIARLQAAKMAKQNSAPKLTPPQTPPTMAMSKGKVDLPKAPFTNNNGKDLTEEQKKARNTELIRLRMEALKKNSSSPTAPSASATPAIASSPGASVAQTPISVQQAPPSSRNVKKAQNNTISSFGNIPGLFMNSASSATAFPTTPTAENSTPKRPLADTEVAQTPARSVGADAAPHPDPMVVDDYNAASIGASRSLAEDVSSAGHSNPRQRATQNASDNAILLELPSRPASVKPVTSALSTPGPQTPGSIALSQEFEDREKQLAAAKTRARERYKEAKQKAQRLAAAAAAPPKSPSKKQNSIPAKVSEMQSEGTGPLTVVGELPSSKTTSILSDGSRDSLNDSKKRRREEIESGLPTLEAEIASNAAKMAQLVKEMESLNASSERMRKDKERLIQELENLGIDTEGMPHAELQAKKDEIVREQEIAADPDATSSDLPIIEGEIMESRTDSIVKDATQNLFQQPQVPGFVSQNGIPGLQASNQQTTALSAYPSTNLGAVDYQRASSGRPVSSVTGGENTNQSGYVDPTRPISAFEHVTEAISSHKSVTPFDDEEDFYSPEPASMLATIKEVDVGQLKSPSEEGEVAMSESDEGEYEPQESPFFAGHPIPDTDIAKRNGVTVNSLSLGQVQVPRRSPDNEDEDPYEPPDIDQPMLDVQSDLMAEASDSSALQGEIDDGEMDMSTSSSDNSNNSDASSTSGVDEYDPESVTPEKELAQVQQLGNPTVPQLQAESTSPGASTQNPVRVSLLNEIC